MSEKNPLTDPIKEPLSKGYAVPNQDMSLDLCRELGLDPEQTTHIEASLDGDRVTVQWQGTARITPARFEELLNRRHH